MLFFPIATKGLVSKHYSLCNTLSARSRNNNVTTAVLFEGYNSHTTGNETKLVCFLKGLSNNKFFLLLQLKVSKVLEEKLVASVESIEHREKQAKL